jgi:hypothetical protein
MNIKIIVMVIITILFVLLQFFSINKNEGEITASTHISKVLPSSIEVETILTTSCYDCHSNKTNYPWYSNIQPLGWWIQHHVDEGKDEVNFSDFTSYKLKKQIHKLEEVVQMIEEDEMPLCTYSIIHHETKLNTLQKKLLINWAKQSINILKSSGTSIPE